MLENEDISVTDQYEHFMQVNHEVAERIVPKQRRLKKNPISGDVRVQEARDTVKSNYHTPVANLTF